MDRGLQNYIAALVLWRIFSQSVTLLSLVRWFLVTLYTPRLYRGIYFQELTRALLQILLILAEPWKSFDESVETWRNLENRKNLEFLLIIPTLPQ